MNIIIIITVVIIINNNIVVAFLALRQIRFRTTHSIMEIESVQLSIQIFMYDS